MRDRVQLSKLLCLDYRQQQQPQRHQRNVLRIGGGIAIIIISNRGHRDNNKIRMPCARVIAIYCASSEAAPHHHHHPRSNQRWWWGCSCPKRVSTGATGIKKRIRIPFCQFLILLSQSEAATNNNNKGTWTLQITRITSAVVEQEDVQGHWAPHRLLLRQTRRIREFDKTKAERSSLNKRKKQNRQGLLRCSTLKPPLWACYYY